MDRLKGLLFDKDGTLIDFNQSWLPPMKAAANLVANHAGQPELATQLLIEGGYLPEQDSWAKDSIIAFETSDSMLKAWANRTSPALIESITPQIQQIVLDALQKAVPVVENIKPLFAKLASCYSLGVASMDDEINVNRTLCSLDLLDNIVFYCGADSGFGHKPEAGMVEAFCAHTEFSASDVAVVGDSLHDLKMARAAGAIAIGVLSGASSERTLASYADYLFPDIAALYEHLVSTNFTFPSPSSLSK